MNERHLQYIENRKAAWKQAGVPQVVINACEANLRIAFEQCMKDGKQICDLCGNVFDTVEGLVIHNSLMHPYRSPKKVRAYMEEMAHGK